MVKWEHTFFDMSEELSDGSPTVALIHDELELHGEQGWELVSVQSLETAKVSSVTVGKKVVGSRYIFKRRKMSRMVKAMVKALHWIFTIGGLLAKRCYNCDTSNTVTYKTDAGQWMLLCGDCEMTFKVRD